MLRALAMAAAVAVAAVLAPSSSAAPPSGEPLTLQIWPGGGPQRTGSAHTLEAQVTRESGVGANGVTVDFEITEGPGDDDVGTAGATPETPDLSCVTAGGSAHRPATCTVSYVEADNVGGSDAVLAWVDDDGLDATVEADLGEGENQHAPGPGGCTVGSKGPGATEEPDATDCVEKRWIARVPAAIDLTPETGWADVGATATLDAVVLDQFGDRLAGPGTAATVAVEILPASAHDPGDGADFGTPDLGTCSTGETGGCSIPFHSTTAGEDVLCAYSPGHEAACSEAPDAPELDNGADVVRCAWGVVASAPGPVETAPDAPAEAVVEAAPTPRDDGARAKRRRAEPDPGSRDDRGREPDPPASEPTPAPQSVPAPAAAVRTGRKARSPRRERRSSSDARSPRRERRSSRDARPQHSRSSRRRVVPRADRSTDPTAARSDERRVRRTGGGRKHRLEQLSRAAAKTAERYSFPLGLALLVLGFIAIQGRIDHRDPKLRLAPVDSKHDLLPFT